MGQEIRKMKKLSSLTAAVLVGATMLSVAGCSGIRYIESEDTFFDALKNTVGIKKRDMLVHEKNTTYSGIDVEYLTFTEDGNNSYCYVRYEDPDDAMERFENKYESFEDILGDKLFDGSNRRMINRDQGYIVLDGDLEKDTEFDGSTYHLSDTHYYGGFYVNKNVYIEVYSVNGSRKDKEKIDAVLKELNLPKP
ncbi:MAG: hypothetical protein K5665_10585 [Saccharofermentans sp.]|nr:hypothetical protein [Saccharofermentans sp.]